MNPLKKILIIFTILFLAGACKTTMESQDRVAYVSISSSPTGARVRINGVYRGQTPGKYSVTPGENNELTLSKGSSAVTLVVKLQAGETRELGTIIFKPKAPAIQSGINSKPKAPADQGGAIVIDSYPTGAMVFLNGKAQRVTPLRIKGLRQGESYTFSVKKAGYKSWSRSVTVGESSKSFMANLKKN